MGQFLQENTREGHNPGWREPYAGMGHTSLS